MVIVLKELVRIRGERREITVDLGELDDEASHGRVIVVCDYVHARSVEAYPRQVQQLGWQRVLEDVFEVCTAL